jgi:hypothetical protein
MKKLLRIAVSVAILFSFIGCDRSTTTAETTADVTTIATTTEVTTELVTVDQAPVFTGVQDITVNRGDEDFDLLSDIVATDAEDGDLTEAITYETDLDFYGSGDYTVTLTVVDSAEHTVTETFTVTLTLTDNQVNLLADVAEISLDVNDLTLPSTGENGTQFYWVTDTPEVITRRGYIINPGLGCDPATVTMTTKGINSGYSEFFSFELVVQPNQEVTTAVFTQRLIDFVGTSEEYVVADQEDIPVYYLNDGALPYIDIRTFIGMVDGALESDILTSTPEGDDVLVIEYETEWEDLDGTIYEDTHTATIDFTENTFTVNNFDFFGNYVASTESDYGEGLIDTAYTFSSGEEVTIPLGFYNFDIFVYDDGTEDNYLMPLSVVNLLVLNSIYYDVYYNGDQLYGIDTFNISGGEEADLAAQELVRTSSYNEETMPDDVKFATYNFLALTMDYFYGLRDTYEVDTFYEELAARAEALIDSPTDTGVYSNVFSAAYAMDDLHTSHVFTGFYEEPYDMTLYLNDLGPGTIDYYEGYWDMEEKIEAKYGSEDNIPELRLLDDDKTAVIYISGFSIDSPDEFKAVMDTLPTTVENVVIDLSNNGGGNLGAVLRIFGYMTEEPILYHSKNPADGATETYTMESSYDAYEYEWYILSSSVTFSAANFMVAMAKELGFATILGQDSSGGASSIGTILLPDGSCLLVSTNSVLCNRVGNEVDGYEYISMQDGIEVDYSMYNVTSDSLLVSTIAEAQADAAE